MQTPNQPIHHIVQRYEIHIVLILPMLGRNPRQQGRRGTEGKGSGGRLDQGVIILDRFHRGGDGRNRRGIIVATTTNTNTTTTIAVVIPITTRTRIIVIAMVMMMSIRRV